MAMVISLPTSFSSSLSHFLYILLSLTIDKNALTNVVWCWLQESICSCGDIVPSNDDDERPPNELAMFCTIDALLLHHERSKQAARAGLPDATNTKTTTTTSNDEHDDGFVDDSVSFLRGIRRTPDTLDFNRKRKLANVKFQLPESEEVKRREEDGALTEIIEECEYDSDIGKFKCRDDDAMEQDGSENSSASSMVDHYLQEQHLNNLNSPPKCVLTRNDLDANNIVDDNESHYKIVMKRIEFFESQKKCEESMKEENVAKEVVHIPTREEQILSHILLIIFILTVMLLIIFPLPN
jgi:hypothetical protein